MIYHPLLDTFIAVVETGSFTQASQVCYISTTAIMKQINELEKMMNCKLVQRSHQGIVLLPSGNLLYEEAVKLRKQNESFMMKMRSVQEKKIFLFA